MSVFQSQGHLATWIQRHSWVVPVDANLGTSCDTWGPAVTGIHRAAPWEDLRCSTGVLACLLPGEGLGMAVAFAYDSSLFTWRP